MRPHRPPRSYRPWERLSLSAERKAHADALFNAKRYSEASDEYSAIAKSNPQMSATDRNALAIYAAVSQFRVKHLSRFTVERLPETSDDSAAAKQYMLAELSRDEHNGSAHDAILAEMIAKYPTSRWLEEALYSGGNMYLLLHDATQAIYHYSTLVRLFPSSTYAPSAHWRAAWMSYRARNYSEAARLMDEQLVRYPGGLEIPAALYWRGRIYEDEEHNFAQAANYYRRLVDIYPDYYYALLARQRMSVLGTQPVVAPAPALASAQKAPAPELTAELPENDTHLIKARLLANAALNEYIAPEIRAAEGSEQWGTLAQGEIYTSYGEYTRALQAMKQSKISFFTQPMAQVPSVYWHLLFPQPYWTELVADSGANGLDPYLVASLIRQESEFNAGAVSRANAYGLMQLIPSTGKSMAKKQGLKRFDTRQLLDPSVNLQLGTRNLKGVLTALAARWSMPSPPTTPEIRPCASGSRQATTRTSLSSLSRFPIPRRATTCRPSCATARCTASFTQRDRRTPKICISTWQTLRLIVQRSSDEEIFSIGHWLPTCGRPHDHGTSCTAPACRLSAALVRRSHHPALEGRLAAHREINQRTSYVRCHRSLSHRTGL